MDSRKELPNSVSNSTIGDENEGAYSSSDTEGPESDQKEEEKNQTVDSDSSDEGTDQDREETSDIEITEKEAETSIKPDTSVESVGTIEDVIVQDQEKSPTEEEKVVNKEKLDLDDTSDLIKQVETGLNSHPMRMEEEVFDGYGEAEEEPTEKSDVDEEVIEEVNIEFKVNLEDDSQSNIPVISITNESSATGDNDSVVEESTVADTDYDTANDSQMTIENEDVSITDNLSDCEDVRIQIESPIPQITVQEALQSVDVDEVSDSKADDLKANKDTVEFDKNLPGTVEILISKVTGAKIYLVGTAHFSKESCEDVAKVINSVNPDVVMLELCKQRTNILHLDEETIIQESQNLTVQKSLDIIREQGGLQGVMYLLLLSMSAHITKELGMAPGGEFRRAFQEAMKIHGCVIHLGDRPIGLTMKRALAALNTWQKIRLGFNVLTSNDSITKEDVEKCKEKDLLENLLEEMAGEFPALSRVFVHERDVYLAHSLQVAADIIQVDPNVRSGVHAIPELDYESSRPRIVVGVVGIGHMKGIMNLFGTVTPDQVREYTTVHPPTKIQRIASFAIKMAVLGGIGYCTYKAVKIPTKFIMARISR